MTTATELPRKAAYSPKEVADRTIRGTASVYKALAHGDLKGVQPTRNCAWSIAHDDMQDWVRRGCPFPRLEVAS